MDNELYYIQLIDDYIEGNLSVEERKKVEDKLRDDEDLRALMEDIRFFREGAFAVFREEVRDVLKKKDAEIEKKTISGSRQIHLMNRPWLYGIAASIVLLVVAYFLFWPPESATPEELFITYYEPYPNLVEAQQRAESIDELNELQTALFYYENSHYEKAATAFEAIDPVEKEGVIWLYEGISHMETGNTDKAISSLKKACELEPALEYPCLWYQGMAYLKNGDSGSAINIMNQLSGTENPYQDRAENILNQLKN